jgi:tRNA uridine 5-carboxymethylaminomethyl modification enzyme
MEDSFQVVVIGGGHAGCEAALAAARCGAKTLLLTQNIDTIGQMSCNPAIGGIGKGHLVKEIDALGGAMALAADEAAIQIRRLNARRGAAVQATRAQADRALYRAAMRRRIENAPNLFLFQQSADDLIVNNGKICGVRAGLDISFGAQAVVLTAGTFLGGVMHIGRNRADGGRAGDAPSVALAARLAELNLPVGRLKTGTPPRLDGATIDFSEMAAQGSDEPHPVFSFLADAKQHPPQTVCRIAHTNERTHDIVREALADSPLHSGAISGVGPRYCPSIEDKVDRHPERAAHQIFLEPEGLNAREIYPNGISTSLPLAAQIEMTRSIRGLENARITRAGYAIEYDFFDPRALSPSLETRAIGGLFFAGQINGTTGYEEAAAQGLLAGANAARYAADLPPLFISRTNAYLGVMIDDLTARGVCEPYRMFTSRAEFRLRLREDNADLRLTEIGRKAGLIGDFRWRRFCERRDAIAKEEERLRAVRLGAYPGLDAPSGMSAAEWLKRPGAKYAELAEHIGGLTNDADARELDARIKYEGYIARQSDEIERRQEMEEEKLPADLDYSAIAGLSAEARAALSERKPPTLGYAGGIAGVSPAALAALQIHLKKTGRQTANK